MAKRRKYQSKSWIDDYIHGRINMPPDVWVLGTTYDYRSCGWAVLHQDGKPHTTLVVTTSDLGEDFMEVAR